MSQVTAAIVAIGDELLSGRTRDKNIHTLAEWLTERGIVLKEARIVADDLSAIADAVNEMRSVHSYVFTSGGIGPTHDDITYEAIAQAFGVAVEEHADAIGRMEKWYSANGEEMTPARRRMAMLPQGARLIENPVSGAPGVCLENVFVMAGVPSIFNAMLAAVDVDIKRGARVWSRAVTARGLPESKIADALAQIQSALKGVAIGSYPIDKGEKGVTVIARSENLELAENAIAAVTAAIRALGVEPEAGDHKDAS